MTKAKNKYHEQLIRKYIEDECSLEEQVYFLEHVETNEFQELLEQAAFDQWKSIEEQYVTTDDQRKMFRLKAEEIIKRKKTNSSFVKKNINYLMQLAAVVCALVGVSVLFYLQVYQSTGKVDVVQTKITNVQAGGRQSLILTDGSNVIVNAESKLSQPAHFSSNKRVVSLEGQAFFKVVHNNKRPFFIETKDLDVKVLGTSFDVKDYDSDNYAYITVKTGKVAVTIKGSNEAVVLLPNQQLQYNKSTKQWKVLSTDAGKCISWTKGSLFFYRTPLLEVAKILTRCYGKEVVIQNVKKEFFISGEHDNHDISAVLEAISFTTGLKYKEEETKIIIY